MKNNSLATLIASIVVIALLFVGISGLVSNLNLDFENPFTDKDKEPASTTASTKPADTTTKPVETTTKAPVTTTAPLSCDHSYASGNIKRVYSSENNGHHVLTIYCTKCAYSDVSSWPCSYQDSDICEYCGYDANPDNDECSHEFNNSSGCTKCDYVCVHPYNSLVVEYNYCVDNTHTIIESCSICGTVTATPPTQDCSFANGVCTLCGHKCPHGTYENGVCTRCGQEQHEFPEPT